MIGAATMRALVKAGLSPEQMIEIADALALDAGHADASVPADTRSKAAIKQAEYRERRKTQAAPPVTNVVTYGNAVTPVVTDVDAVNGANQPMMPAQPVTQSVTSPVTRYQNDAAPFTPPLSPPDPQITPPIIPPKPKARAGEKRELAEGWQPEPFGDGTASRSIVDGWPPGELRRQVEGFTAHHRKNATRFANWQSAWSTWVLNSERFGKSRNEQRTGHHRSDGGIDNPMVRASIAVDRELADRQRGLGF